MILEIILLLIVVGAFALNIPFILGGIAVVKLFFEMVFDYFRDYFPTRHKTARSEMRDSKTASEETGTKINRGYHYSTNYFDPDEIEEEKKE